MCEILGLTAKRKIKMNRLLETFFSHSEEHRNGWGLALLDGQHERHIAKHLSI